MSQLREEVKIITASGELEGYLFVGADGLPELLVHQPRRPGPPCGVEQCIMVEHGAVPSRTECYRPATFPAAWSLRYSPQEEPPILYAAWRAIEDVRQQIVDAQREEEREDDDKERARESAVENRIAQEIEEDGERKCSTGTNTTR